MMSLKQVARELGEEYQTIRYHVGKLENELVKEGVMKVKEGIATKRYYVCVSPEEFFRTLKKLVKRRSNNGGNGSSKRK